MERRLGDLSAELEPMVKSELMGRLSHFETQIDEKLAQLSDRLQAIETAKSAPRSRLIAAPPLSRKEAGRGVAAYEMAIRADS